MAQFRLADQAKPRRDRFAAAAEAGKLFLAAMVFVGIFGGYLGVSRALAAQRDAHRLLPGADQPTGRCTIWFMGSSTMFKWTTLARDMRSWDARNRGVNGATIAQLTRWWENDPPGRPPAAIVWYAGENDIRLTGSASAAFGAFERLLDSKTRRFGAAPVLALTLKPSPTRWMDFAKQTQFNAALYRLAATRRDLSVLDVRPLLLVNGRPGPFYVADGIHMNAVGYARWTASVRPAIARMLPAATVDACLRR